MHLGDFEKGLETSKEVNVTNHLEAEVYNCVVRGQVPKGLDGTFYRYLPDFPWSRIDHDDVFINGNGCIDAVRFQNGHVDFKQRYVRMAKFVIERAARQAVLGKYGNRYMEDPRVKHMIHSTAHSNIVYYQNQLLATKMDSLPYVVDPDTMETKGVYDYNGQYKAPTHTARPKIDPRNGELITMGYETKGDSSPDIAYYLFDRNAKKLEECWVKGPYASMILDVAATDKWIVFVLNPLAAVPVEMMHTVHHHFACDPQKPAVFGVLPRRGPKPEDVKWFHFENTFIGHTGNAFDGEEGCIYMDTSVKYEKLFWSSSPEQRSNLPLMPPDPSKHKKGSYVRWRLDPNANDLFVKPIELIDLEGDTPKIDERFQMQPYKSLFFNTHVGAHKEGPKGASWNAIARCDVETGKYDIWNAGPDTALHGVAFSPRGSDGEPHVYSSIHESPLTLYSTRSP
ncbi:carotenoid oxygenase [Aspergillus welwitschiae]|uniref:Carotenoid oxygenase n=1 Tax=Aspergillus welwitschiae TaxID=1341132 RepID=A0A3F3PKV5_9EURO|nr:carotenoid oxygenase [Aspergillus welwitschiae]RDH27564.1 carotenoid oxygenase [Aspergillus welwitschiae]